MTVAVVSHAGMLEHEPLAISPEQPARLLAALDGAKRAAAEVDVAFVEATPADVAVVRRVHDARYLERLAAADESVADEHTFVGPATLPAALLATGACLGAVHEIEAGRARHAFAVVRPPGHHAERDRAIGFCVINHVAVVAADLVARGERVLIVDVDAHHGNGTQSLCGGMPGVGFVSVHGAPAWPRPADGAVVAPRRNGFVVNVGLPAGATGDVAVAAVRSMGDLAARLAPTWLLVSAGFDVHAREPTGVLALDCGDIFELVVAARSLAPGAPVAAVLEGGYDEAVISASAEELVRALGDAAAPKYGVTAGGPGAEVIGTLAVRARGGGNDVG